MATLTGKTIAATYTSLLKLEGDSGSTVAGASGNAVQIKTGDDDATPLYLNTDRVGIGDPAPDVKLHIRDSGGGSVLKLENSSSGDNVSMTFSPTVGGGATTTLMGTDTGHAAGAAKFIITHSSETVFAADSNGNVGIGTAAPVHELTISSPSTAGPALELKYAGDADPTAGTAISNQVLGEILFSGNDSNINVASGGAQADNSSIGAKIVATATAAWGDAGNDNDDSPTKLEFFTQSDGTGETLDAARMTILSDGNVGIGKTNPGEKFNVTGDASGGTALVQFENTHDSVVDNDHVLMLAFSGQANAAEGNFIIFRDNDTPEMGVIKAADGSVVVDAYSDYRIKNTIATLSGGLTRVNALRPVTFKYNTDSGNATHEGFIAHEVQEHVPYAVRGAKDAVRDDGSVKSQSFCIYQLIPQLVSAIQELSAKVTALENA